MELPFKETPHRVITRVSLNLQKSFRFANRGEEVTPDQWMEISFELQPKLSTKWQRVIHSVLSVLYY